MSVALVATEEGDGIATATAALLGGVFGVVFTAAEEVEAAERVNDDSGWDQGTKRAHQCPDE